MDELLLLGRPGPGSLDTALLGGKTMAASDVRTLDTSPTAAAPNQAP